MAKQNNSEIFPNLNRTVLKVYAENWAQEFPLIREIRLYRRGVESDAIYIYPKEAESDAKYIFIVTHPDPPKIDKEIKRRLVEQVSLETDELKSLSNEAKLLSNIKYYEWKSSCCLHIKDQLIEFYKDQPDTLDYDHDWMWFTIKPGESIPSGIVNENHYWILYKDNNIESEPIPENFLINARMETEQIYSAIKKDPGINDRNRSNGDTLRQEAALRCFRKHKINFKILKEKYLNKTEIYKIGSRPKREIIGRILREITLDKGLDPKAGQELYITSQMLLKPKLPNQSKK
jgi:hypothetical protein